MCARFHWLPSAEQRAAWEEAAWAKRAQINLIETANIFFRCEAPGQKIQKDANSGHG